LNETLAEGSVELLRAVHDSTAATLSVTTEKGWQRIATSLAAPAGAEAITLR